MLVTVSVAAPVFVIVKVSCVDKPTSTPPKLRSPLSAIAPAIPLPDAAIVLPPLKASLFAGFYDSEESFARLFSALEPRILACNR